MTLTHQQITVKVLYLTKFAPYRQIIPLFWFVDIRSLPVENLFRVVSLWLWQIMTHKWRPHVSPASLNMTLHPKVTSKRRGMTYWCETVGSPHLEAPPCFATSTHIHTQVALSRCFVRSRVDSRLSAGAGAHFPLFSFIWLKSRQVHEAHMLHKFFH